MQHEFDNTFESLLRRAVARSRGEVLPENAEHLDADSISAFAENALPETARARFAAHLADCSDCRQILVNFAAIQEAEESEIIENKAIVSPQTTWKERFARWFALPALGYAAAALTILFIGVFGFIALQSRQQKPAEIAAKIEADNDDERAEQKRRTRAQAPQPEPTIESTPDNSLQANSADSSNANLAENSNQNAEQSPNEGLPPSYRVITKGLTNSAETSARQREPEPQRESNRSANASNTAPGASANTLAAPPAPTASVSPSKTETVAQSAPIPTKKAEVKEKANDEESSQTAGTQALDAQKSQVKPAATLGNTVAARTVGNKTFQKLDGVWRDSVYNGQTTETVARNSDEYKKLDGGLRSIADNFRGETVIVVWQGKAYRIR